MTPAQLLDQALIIKELKRLAALPELEPRGAELTALHRDMSTDTRLDRWAELDLVGTYVRPESVRLPPEPTSGRRDRLLEAALGVLVFIPLLITWFGLREAVRAYGELSEEDPKQSTRPFLQLWQSGFGGHLSSFGRFENVALMAVLLIALLVGLSVWHARVRAHAERDEAEQEAAREKLLAQLASVLTRAQMHLAPRRSASPQQFTSELTKAAEKLSNLTTTAGQSHQALTGATASVAHATDTLKQAAEALAKEVPKLGAAADRIDSTLRNGTAETAKAGRANALAARGIADHVKTAGDTVEASLKALVSAQQSLVTKSESVAKATERASQALVSSTGRTGDAVDGMREATERWDAAAAHWQDAAARLDARMDSLAGALPALTGGLTGGAYAGTSPAGASFAANSTPFPGSSADSSLGPGGPVNGGAANGGTSLQADDDTTTAVVVNGRPAEPRRPDEPRDATPRDGAGA
ncbi:hypothetical protein [Streptomyces formicae]|uniref:Methyl-accepting chemotaxis protein n=1 Tax=Streptomyces formicae TaxID=1616117 RepID=A0A291QHM3_9ACTN|nr:hypothetical protein [Streptomyces formicae]ATL31310.1 hypothetical protein KY5_6292c [Streptomyces formicae]